MKKISLKEKFYCVVHKKCNGFNKAKKNEPQYHVCLYKAS